MTQNVFFLNAGENSHDIPVESLSSDNKVCTQPYLEEEEELRTLSVTNLNFNLIRTATGDKVRLCDITHL